MKTLRNSQAPAIAVMSAVGIAAAVLWISGQSHAASTASVRPAVETNSIFVQDSCVDAALKLKLMIHRAGPMPNASIGGDGRGCGGVGASVTKAESLHSASATPDPNPVKPSPEQEKS